LNTIQEATEAYITDLDALQGMVGPLLLVTETLGKKFSEEYSKALEEHGEEVAVEGTRRRFKIPPEHLRKVRLADRKKEQYRTAKTLLPRTFLVSFVSTYDAFIGNLVHALFECKPEVLNSSGKQLTYKELVAFKDVETARKYVVDSEVEALLRKSHTEQFDWLEKVFDIKLREGLDSWPIFIELTERRNLFVHCQGKASSQYLKVCAENNVDTADVTIGVTLDAKRKYLTESYKCLYEIGVKLSQVLWRKLRPDELEIADRALITVTFELIVLEKYDLANRLLKFATKLPRHASEANKRILLVNLAQSYKFMNKQEQCLSTLSKVDWSACSDDFDLCVTVLKDQFKKAATIMRNIGPSGLIKRHDYIDWPIFKEFRKTSEFETTYTEIFGVEPTELLTQDTTPVSERNE